MTSPESTRKLPVTKVLVAFSLLLVIFLCGGGLLYVDYHAGSLSSTFLPADDTNPVMEVSARWRGFRGGGTRVGSNSNNGEILLGIGEQEFTVARDAVKYQGEVLAELPTGASSVEVVAYRGASQIIVDGKIVSSLLIEAE